MLRKQKELNFHNGQNKIYLINKFRKTINDKLELLDYSGANQHMIVKGVEFKTFKENVLDKMIFPRDSNIQGEFFDRLEESLRKCNIIPIIDIVWIRDKLHETRSVDESGYIKSQMFQGYNSKYCGDADIITPDRNDIMQLQIHYIKPINLDNMEYYSPALALYIPLEYSEAMSKLVKKA